MHILGLTNIREASVFPRDMERVDLRLSTQANGGDEDSSAFEQLLDFLNQAAIDYQLFEHKPVFTSEEAAKVRGTKPEQGAKALVMYADRNPIMVVLPGNLKVDVKQLKADLGFKDIKMATPEEVRKLTGVEIGAVPPFGNLFKMSLYVESKLSANYEIAFNAGRHDRSIKMKYADFIKLTKPQIGSFSAQVA